MNGFNNFTFNPRYYEDHLSVFGRKVLNLLVEKWRSDQNHVQRPLHGYYQHGTRSMPNRRVLTFRDNEPHLSSPPVIFEEINSGVGGNNQHQILFDFVYPEPNVPVVSNESTATHDTIPTRFQLVQAIEEPLHAEDYSAAYTDVGDSNMFSCDLINPVIERRIPTDVFDNDNNNGNFGNSKTKINEADKGNSDVNWDNMFDTELILMDTAISDAQHVSKQIESPTPNTFSIRLHKENDKAADKNKSREKAKNTDKMNTKSKNQPTDAVTKKVKKVSAEPKINFSKQKYTKAVKNWLTSVDPNHPVDERDNDLVTQEPRVQAQVVIDKLKQKPNKKMVQAQLANRDGIMKFRMPKSKSFENPETTQENASSYSGETTENRVPQEQAISMSLENKNSKNYSNEKTLKENKCEKVSSKEESQIPVRHIEFDITTVDGNNITQCMDTLKSAGSQQLVAVLIYRNGFCQLNKHHTEDKCDPEGFLLNMSDVFFLFKEEQSFSKEVLRAVLEKNTIVCYDGKSLLMYFKAKLDLDIHKFNIIDAEIGGSILESDHPPSNFSELQKLVSFTPQYTVATECPRRKAAWYCSLLRDCANKLCQILHEEQLEPVFYEIEMKLLPIIAEMEELGVTVDLEKLKTMEDILVSKMKAVELECHQAAGRSFQVTSPAQVRALIYDELRLDAKCNLKVRETIVRGAKSTSEATLRGLVGEHALPRLVLEYRHLHKAHATFLVGIAHHVRHGLVKPTWLQTAATGRIACSNPNLQAVPKTPFSLVLFPEHAPPEDIEHVALNFRSVYVARAGCVLLACDFRHVECRVWAHLAADVDLLQALREPGDFFHVLAQKWLGKPAGEVTAADRERTKRVVYAALYGAGARKLQDILDVSYDQALSVLASFNRSFPSLKSWGLGVLRACTAARGRLASLAGRVRRVPDVASALPARRERAERQAVNFLIQGSAADLCKLAMVRAVAALRARPPPLRARLLLQIHDELVWEVHETHLHDAAQVIQSAMEACGRDVGLHTPLPVALAAGRSWGEVQTYHV